VALETRKKDFAYILHRIDVDVHTYPWQNLAAEITDRDSLQRALDRHLGHNTPTAGK
jgi:hypothetical protein